jgi:hypothetical protein
MYHWNAVNLPDRWGIGWLRGDYIAAPAGLAWHGNLWCWGRLRSHGGRLRRHWDRSTVHRCLITEQGHSSARWSAIDICRCTRLDRELATDRTRISDTCDRGTSRDTCWGRHCRGVGVTRWEKREHDDPHDKCSCGNYYTDYYISTMLRRRSPGLPSVSPGAPACLAWTDHLPVERARWRRCRFEPSGVVPGAPQWLPWTNVVHVGRRQRYRRNPRYRCRQRYGRRPRCGCRR